MSISRAWRQLSRILYWRYKKIIIGFILAHSVFFLVLGLQLNGRLETIDLNIYDWFLKQKTNYEHKIANIETKRKITIIWVTDADQRRFGWPLVDDQLVTALNQLLAAKPRVIGLDLYRDLPVPINKQPAYNELCNIFRQNQNIIGIEKIVDDYGVKVDPPPCLDRERQVGFNDLILDKGGIVRRGLFFMTAEHGRTVWSFSLRLALKYLEYDGIYLQGRSYSSDGFLGQGILPRALTPNFGGYVNTDAAGYQFLMTFPNATQNFNQLTFGQLLDGNFKPELIQDKIVIIGTKAEATPDFFHTPINEERLAGAEIHAYAANQLLQIADGKNVILSSWTYTQGILWLWLWAVLGVGLCLWLAKNIFNYISILFAGLAVLLIINYISFMLGWWLLFAAPLLAWVLAMLVTTAYRSYQNGDERKILMSLFRGHVSKEVAEIIWQSHEQYLSRGRLRPKRAVATILFLDIDGFNTLSEQHNPEQLVEWLNEYMEIMVHTIEQYHGQVNKFIGDAIMATFGIPVINHHDNGVAQDAVNAVECALALRKQIIDLNERWQEQGLAQLRARVGIYTGSLVVGSVGSRNLQEYAILGDTVDAALRLQNFDNDWGNKQTCRILIGDSTCKYLGDNYRTQYVDMTSVGKKSIKIYQLHSKQNLTEPKQADFTAIANG
jgi:adenylate cyclase